MLDEAEGTLDRARPGGPGLSGPQFWQNSTSRQKSVHRALVPLELLMKSQYSAVVLDFDEPGAAQVAQMVHLARSERPPLVVALVTQLGPVRGAFQAGIKFVLYKPLKAGTWPSRCGTRNNLCAETGAARRETM